MKKRNLVTRTAIASAVLFLSATANAGSMVGTNVNFAAENFGPSIIATASITPSIITYSMSSSTTVAASGTIIFVIRLTGAKFAATPVASSFTYAGASLGTKSSSINAGAITLSNDGATLALTVSNNTGSSTNLGVGAFTYTPAAGDVINVGSLGTVGATVSATASVTTAAQTASTLDSTNAIPSSIDGATPTVVIATSVSAISASVSALPAYTNKIDLTVSPAATDYVLRATGVNDGISLGSVTFLTTAGRKNLGATADYTLAAGSGGAAASATILVTPNAGQSFPVGSVLSYDITSTGCIAANQKGALTAFTALTNSTAKTLVVTSGNLTTATPIFVCMTKPSTGNTATPITATLLGSTVPSASADAATSVTGVGYAVSFNGSSKDVRTYVPASATGYSSSIRIINSGTVSAAVSGAFVDPVTGLAGSNVVVIPSLAAGAASTLTSAQIEAAIGGTAPAATARPRLRFTAPTNSLEIQSFILSPNGTFSDVTGAQ